MPDYLDQLQALNKKNNPEDSQEPQPHSQSLNDQLSSIEQEGQAKAPPSNLQMPDGSLTSEEDQANANAAQYDREKLGPTSSDQNQERFFDPTAVNPDVSARGFIEESATSVARGIGKHIIKGTGDLLQVSTGWAVGSTADGNMLSRGLQEAGEEFASNFKSFMPEELKAENLSFQSALNPKFWSTHVAEMIPQLVEFIALSKGGSVLAKAGAKKLAKNALAKGGLKGAKKIANGREVYGTGSGISGRFFTEKGLSTLGEQSIGAIGGGVSGNTMSGMLNAAQLVNDQKLILDPETGERIFDDAALAEMAAGTMRNNAAWLAFDIASWGMTYGGGRKAFAAINPLKKGKTIANAAQRLKTSSNLFKYDVAPIFKGLGRVAKKAGFEAIEETFQETFEEWAAKKATAKSTGFFSDDLFDAPSFLDFYMSDENRPTLVLSAALGGLGGAAFNIKSLINEKADDAYRLHNRQENLSSIIEKQGTEEELSWNNFHKRQQISDIVIDGRTDLYEDFISTLVENGSITEDEKLEYDEMLSNFQAVKEKGKALNVKGLEALMKNNADETFADKEIEMQTESHKAKLEAIEEIEAVTKKDIASKNKKIAEVNASFEKSINALSIIKAQAKQNQNNLILGTKANPMDIKITRNEFGDEMFEGGLSTEQYKEYTKEGEESSNKEGIKIPDFKAFNYGNISKKIKDVANSISNTFLKKETSPEENVEEDSEESSASETSGTTEVDGKKVETPKTDAEAEAEAQDAIEEIVIDPNETMLDEEYYNFKDNEGDIEDNTLNEIAQKIYRKEPLSAREEEVREYWNAEVKARIKEQIIGLNQVIQVDPSKKGIQNEDGSFSPSPTQEGPKNKISSDPAIREAQNAIKNDKNLTENEKEFAMQVVANDDSNSKSAKKVQKSKNKKAKRNFKPRNVKNSAEDAGFDKRDNSALAKTTRAINISNYIQKSDFIKKLKLRGKTNSESISQNEIDNFLNQYTTYNLEGPSNVDKMNAVNYQLKRMFPNKEFPVRTYIVKNLLESVGSQGVGHSLLGTIYIDEKNWKQDKVFMHELSHIYYQLAYNEPEVQNLLKKALANPKRIKEIKNLYNDYILYDYKNPDGSYSRYTKKKALDYAISLEKTPDQAEEFVAELVASGEMKEVLLREQELIKEELFVSHLETPLSNNLDKIFSRKEPQRQNDVKKFWGMLRKKGAIIEDEGNVFNFLEKINDNDLPDGSLKDLVFASFKAATSAVTIDSYGLDAREQSTEYSADLNEIGNRIVESRKRNERDDRFKLNNDDLLDLDNSIEQDGEAFFDKSFDAKIKGATRIMKRFGTAYNKAVRLRDLRKGSKKKSFLFDKESFEALVFNLATENNDVREFIYNIENSAIREVKAFNQYLDKVHSETKESLLESMHFVLSNGTHVSGLSNNIAVAKPGSNKKFVYSTESSLSNRELTSVQNTLSALRYDFDNKTESWSDFENSVEAIKNDEGTASDYAFILEMLGPKNLNLAKMLELGVITYKGVNIPIETLISGYIKKGYLANKNGKGIYVYNAKNLADSIIQTNRKFTPFSSVANAEGNMEPVRITNNHLTKEVNNLVEFLKGDDNGKPDLDAFLDKFSHVNHKNKKMLGKKYVPNQMLVKIYNDFQKGILPAITQFHGIKSLSNNDGSLFKNSTATEQSLNDFLNFATSSTKADGKRTDFFLSNLGTFADSPRKFFMNMKRISYDQVFTRSGRKVTFNPDGEVLNSMFNLHNEIFEDLSLNTKTKYKKELVQSIKNTIDFINNNGAELSDIEMGTELFTNGKLNVKGRQYAAEYVINSIMSGYNVSDTFLPGIKERVDKDGNKSSNIIKRFKMNSSPILSVNNPNFKMEPLFFSDEIIGNGIAGTDAGMFILKEDAEKLQGLGAGVFDMNNGFKLLNASVEKNNPKLKGKSAYLKGYTTIIDESHPLYKVMKSRKDKYNKWHKEKYGVEPSEMLNDNSPNHMVIAIPASSDKSNFNPSQYTTKKDGQLEYTEDGLLMNPESLNQNFDAATKQQDDLYYDKDGNFVGIETYNFGPQQLMDKITDKANTPVQMVNSIIVNATLNGDMDLVTEILEHISNQKRQFLNDQLDQIKSKSPNSYRSLIEEGLNKENMNQAQLILFEEGGSLANPYLNEIVVNQFAKTIRKVGNKLQTPGTYSHQKPDLGYKLNEVSKTSSRLKTYEENSDGTISPAEIVLPKHMMNKVKPRVYFGYKTRAGKAAISNIDYADTTKSAGDTMSRMKNGAIDLARKRFKKNPSKYVYEHRNEEGILIGYYVSGETVIASRVPGHGPSSTGVFEVVTFDESSNGNQVMVPSEFNEITGADNDGDALFIQTKGDNKTYGEWNNAFDKLTDYWLSSKMKNQVRTKMDFVEETEQAVKDVKSDFPDSKNYVFPFSPEQRMVDYNNTMVSKRNVGPVFNIHKIANLMAAYETEISRPVEINKKEYLNFKDEEVGNNSRNQRSAKLANIILDNAKYGFADDLGIDEHNIAQATLMVNLGISITDVGRILNSKPAKLWSEYNRNNNSAFHSRKKKATIVDDIYKKLQVKRNEKISLKIDTKNLSNKSQFGPVIELMNYLSDMNGDVMKISAVMSGHNKIHVNPFVLEKQLNDFRDVVNNNNEKSTVSISDDFKSNPDIVNYVEVAEATLDHVKTLNPVYRKATEQVLKSIEAKIGSELTVNEIESISKDLQNFITSRLLSHNNVSTEYAKNLISKTHKDSIFNKLKAYMNPLKSDIVVDPKDERNNTDASSESILFGKALNYSLTGNAKFISANTEFVNDSFSKEERAAAQREFQELDKDLKDDLILYDLISNGWKGPFSIAPFFEPETMSYINMASDFDFNSKDDQISGKVLREAEKLIALKQSKNASNPFFKIFMDKNEKVDNFNEVMTKAYKDKSFIALIESGKPVFINARKGSNTALFEMQPLTAEERITVNSEKDRKGKTNRILEISKKKWNQVRPDLGSKSDPSSVDVHISTITDSNLTGPHKSYNNYDERPDLEKLTKASISYSGLMESINGPGSFGMDAREDFYEDTFTKLEPLTKYQFERAMEFKPTVSKALRQEQYNEYLKSKASANEKAKTVLKGLEEKSTEEVKSMYTKYGDLDVYAYSIITTPVVKELAKRLASDQAELLRKNGNEAFESDNDVSKLQAYMMSGSTIPSGHPAAQGMARMLEVQYKKFTEEKKKYVSEMNKITDALYKEKLGYGDKKTIMNTLRRIRDTVFSSRTAVYDSLYGNLVIREEVKDNKGNLTTVFKLRTEAEVNDDFAKGYISKAEKDFYDFFRKTTEELKPKRIKKTQEDYIPHTSMSTLESFSARGLLGLLINSKGKDEAIYDVKMYHTIRGEKKLVNFKTIEDQFKQDSADVYKKNNINSILAYQKAKKKALKLLKSGKNENGTQIFYSNTTTETALGFGAINRFANNRSVKSKELPSMDLNKALGDYIHSSIFVDGAGEFQGMRKLQGYIDGVLAHNSEKGFGNLNDHVQKVWKDYFLRGKRQTSFVGEKGDKVIRGLTRMNLFYSLGYQANKNTGGLYALGNIMLGKYQNIKDVGAKAWVRGESKYWGLDKGMEGGLSGVVSRHKRMSGIIKTLNFMEINVYDEVNMEKKNGLDAVFSDLALMPMIKSEEWIQRVHMIGLLTDEELDLFDAVGNYKNSANRIDEDRLVELEDQVKASHGRGYQPTDQRAVQMYSWGNMMLQFSKFLPTMVHDRFSKKEINIYGKETIGSLRAVGNMVRRVVNNPEGFVEYRNSLSPELRKKLDQGLKGMAMASIVGIAGGFAGSDTANELFWDSNYYFDHERMIGKLTPPTVRSASSLVSSLF